jgi:phospholipase C
MERRPVTHVNHRRTLSIAAALGAVAVAATMPATAGAKSNDPAGALSTTTPIKHLVVIFQENVSFDHYFGTYPNAQNPKGEPSFTARPGTPSVNGLSQALLTSNPNSANPQRLSRSQAHTCDMNHDYTPEQSAADHGAMDQFVENSSSSSGPTLGQCLGGAPTPGNMAVMDYYDGNTVTAMWNYAQHFAMSDNSYGTGYGPSTPGVLNLVAGNTYGASCGPQDGVNGPQPDCGAKTTQPATPGQPQPQGTGTVYGDPDPMFDTCSGTGVTAVGGKNVGDLLNTQNVTWGWFQGGFASPGYVPGQPSSDNLSRVCTGTHTSPVTGAVVKDYSAHHQPFEYYASTANPQHLPPTSVARIGAQDQANHQYDLSDFWASVDNGSMPAVSFVKAARYQDGHAGNSNPLDEQTFLVDTINKLQNSSSWKNTAVVIAYDDSDGWYDHAMPPVLIGSQTQLDTLTNAGQCGNARQVPTTSAGAAEQTRCGFGPRLPLLVISPFAKQNAVDHSITDQSSILRFVEDNWSLGRLGDGSYDAGAGTLLNLFDMQNPSNARLILDPSTGQPTSD